MAKPKTEEAAAVEKFKVGDHVKVKDHGFVGFVTEVHDTEGRAELPVDIAVGTTLMAYPHEALEHFPPKSS